MSARNSVVVTMIYWTWIIQHQDQTKYPLRTETQVSETLSAV